MIKIINSCLTNIKLFIMQSISIEGNIGSGKTTLLAYLKEIWAGKNIIFVREPVDEWEKIKDEKGTTMLEKFYKDQEKYSFSFQMMAFISRLKLLKEAVENNPNAIIITERSLYTDKLVFAKMLYDSNKIEHINYLVYLNWFETFAEKYPLKKIIYIKTDPEICLSRIEKRSRKGENLIPLTYLSDCHLYHNEMIDSLPIEKIILDGNVDIYNEKEILEDWINKIEILIKI